MNIYKLSMGVELFDTSDFEQLLSQGLVSMHPDTHSKGKKIISQGEEFLEADKGDIFYVCRSNHTVELIGMFSDKKPVFSSIIGHEDWVDRSYNLLYKAKNQDSYNKQLNKWWAPKNNSTFIHIPENELDEFESEILQPVFQCSLKEVRSKRDQKIREQSSDLDDFVELQKRFSEYSKDTTKFLSDINDLNELELLKLHYNFSIRGDVTDKPVVLLRKKLLEYLIDGQGLNTEVINNTKREISSKFEKNVFHAWKNPFRILYTFLYDAYKDELIEFFSNFAKQIQEDLKIADSTTFNLVHLDGPQNQGYDRIWFAIYSNTYPNQKLAKQLLFSIHNGFEYGYYEEATKKRDRLQKVQTLDYKKLLQVFESYKTEVVMDNSIEKAMISKYIEILEHKKQIVLQGPPGTGKTFTAKKIRDYLVGEENSEQWKIIQFHPSYTYEDFVRGISSKSEGGEIVYETENKLFASFAEKALRNFDATNQDVQEFSKRQEIGGLLEKFSEMVQDEIDENQKYKITDFVSIIEVEEDAFRYQGNWKTSTRMKFSDIIDGQLNNVQSRQEFKKLEGISGTAKQHASYFFKVIKQFQDYSSNELSNLNSIKIEEPELKTFVLIIDEINRANLPSVLGELIYGLEYRGSKVESMYALDGDHTIIIPENLYIIGTMNTADRSVGHIDYAIKRRFAFVDVLPNQEVIQYEKAKELFSLVSSLFVSQKDGVNEDSQYLAPDFNYTEVQIGHSYFMLESEDPNEQSKELNLRLSYEILPLLREYIKDGLLLDNAKELINEIEKFEC